MSMRGNGRSTCYDCGGVLERDERGPLGGVCASCAGTSECKPCIEGCGKDAGETTGDGRCPMCHEATAGARA